MTTTSTPYPVSISVCIPVYNAAAYLKECLDSICAQSFHDFEILIADDGSTDESAQIAASYPDARIRLFRLPHDFIATSNFLLDAARGKYIARMDADDVMCPDRLQFQYDYLESHPEIDIVGGGMHFIGFENKRYSGGDAYEYSLELLLNGNGMNHPTVMMRRARLVEKGLRYKAEYIYAEDFGFWAEALMAGLRIVSLPKAFIAYRVSYTQVSCRYFEAQERAAQRVRQAIIHARIAQQRHTAPESDAEVLPPRPGNRLTVIMPFLNEHEEVERTLESIRQSAGDRVEIIAINDHSADDYDYASAVRRHRASYIVNTQRMGVAASRDKGVALCRTPYFLLLDAHMRFYDSRWPERLINLLDEDDRVLLCCQTRVLRKENGKVEADATAATPYGAVSAFRRNTFWPDIEWSCTELHPEADVEAIPNVLGAGYAASRNYWHRLKGLQGLKSYGSDEAYISFKIWREGGRCLLVKDVVIGHIYRPSAPYKRYVAEEVYNELLISYLTFSQSWRCHSFAAAAGKNHELYMSALAYLAEEKENIEALKAYLDTIYTVPFDKVLQLHKSKLVVQAKAVQDKALLAQVNRFVMEHPVTACGLYEGKAGQLLWFTLYRRWSGDNSPDAAMRELDADLRRHVSDGVLPGDFREGLCGIGWTYIFLHTQGLLAVYPEDLLSSVDRQLAAHLPQLRGKSGLDRGEEGLLAYAALRLKTGTPQWDADFTEKLTQLATVTARHGSCMASIYYALLVLDVLRQGPEAEKFQPRISEWMKKGQHLPSSPKYWKPILVDGCIGAVISFICP